MSIPARLLRSLLLATVASTPFCAALAQSTCGLGWVPAALPGTDGPVFASAEWDPDGAGPLPAHVVIGGAFHFLGQMPADGLATWDPATGQWNALATVTGEVRSILPLPNGDLVIGGQFSAVGGVPAAHVARWNGTSWSGLGAGLSGGSSTFVETIVQAPNGDLIVGGAFTMAGSIGAASIARWNGASWSALDVGLQTHVRALAYLPNGDLVAGGSIDVAGSVPVANLARYDGVVWSDLGGGVSGPVYSLLVLTNGELLVSGGFYSAGGVSVSSVASWNGSSWAPRGSLAGVVDNLRQLANGNLLATAGGTQSTLSSVHEWNGATWTDLGPSADTTIMTLLLRANGEFLIGGGFTSIAGQQVSFLARWDTVGWGPMVGSGAPTALTASNLLVPTPDGGLLALNHAALSTAPIVQWDGLGWRPMSGSYPSPVLQACAAVLADGTIVLGGAQGGLKAWNGTAWVPWLSVAGWLQCQTMVGAPDGSLVLAANMPSSTGITSQHVVRLAGGMWTALSPLYSGTMYASAYLPNGDLVVAGAFTSFAGVAGADRIARFDGTAWSALGTGCDGTVRELAVLPNGDLIACGAFQQAGGVPAATIARWDGAAWHDLGAAMVATHVAALPDGDVMATGTLTSGGPAVPNAIARWQGTGWQLLGQCSANITGLAVTMRGQVIACGPFRLAGGVPSPFYARLDPACPATSASYGTACPGTTGTPTLATVVAPWLGGVAHSRVRDLAPGSFGFAVVGFASTTLPLANFHPAAGPTCLALATADAVTWLPAVGGQASLSFGVPMAPPLVGLVLLEQIVQAELDASGALSLLSSSNGLALTVGAL